MHADLQDTVRALGRSPEHRFDRRVRSVGRPNLFEETSEKPDSEYVAASFLPLLLKLAAVMVAIAVVIFGLSKFYGSIIAQGGHTLDTTSKRVVIANEVLEIPANMMRFRTQRRASNLDRVDLYAHWPSMAGYSQTTAALFDMLEGAAPIIFMTIQPRDMTTDMSGRVSTIYENFFAGPPVDAGNGLVRRAFSSQSAYVMEELFYELNSPYPFAARCMRENDAVAGAFCIRDIHLAGDLSINYRFHKSLIGEWRELDRQVRATVESFLLR